MRARKLIRLSLSAGIKILLQRGRACEGAEIVSGRPENSPPIPLQRGRACEGAEMPGSATPPPARLSLQRGRACEGAEIVRFAVH